MGWASHAFNLHDVESGLPSYNVNAEWSEVPTR